MRRQSQKTLAATALVGLLATGGLGHAQEPIKIGVPVGLSGANSVVAPSVVQAGELAVEEINAAGGVLGRPLELVVADDGSGAAGRAEGVRFAGLPAGGGRPDLDGDQRRAQCRPADRQSRPGPVHLHLVLRGPLLQPLDVRERLGARAAGGADRRPFHEGVRRQELLPDRQRLRFRARHARVHAAVHRGSGRRGARRGISADGRHRLDRDHQPAEERRIRTR